MPTSLLPPSPPPPRRNQGRRLALQAIAAAAGLLAVGHPMWAQPAPFDLDALMRLLGSVRAGRAGFVERRTVSMLDRTLESSGTMSFEAPDRFVRETERPRRERLAVEGNRVTMTIGSRSRTVALDSVPEAAVVVDAIRGTLTGDRALLDRHFASTVDGSAARWTLELRPREPRLRELVVSVRMAGEQALVRQVTVAMADGDRSVMTLEPVSSFPPGGSSTPAPAASAGTTRPAV